MSPMSCSNEGEEFIAKDANKLNDCPTKIVMNGAMRPLIIESVIERMRRNNIVAETFGSGHASREAGELNQAKCHMIAYFSTTCFPHWKYILDVTWKCFFREYCLHLAYYVLYPNTPVHVV